ncbi:exodeoxyribonuclease V subunit gamma [Paucibacter sp. R3-3]|uniref:RecBCD enzyme subunit RecC n=1 Tax=Roseateles agri TaxID=3098619 RepID=A0ABU5DK82_9BURK|nr:exodeoxyribonuclease V subunit gamma [Paucibacter sp. R3-3]MDY0746705.1 exodeoxyribonuclease V subunit gamma [Paucibacter sp. R3-3]
MKNEITPGLLVLHGNRAELLGEALIEWLASHPLAPLEEEVFLVQSNGVAEWLKMSIAARRGVCAATKVELPARFLWRAYRQVLGRDAVPATSGFDKLPLTWRLMQLLPELLDRPVFAPLAGFLRADGGEDLSRRLQLAERLADLYDQYQVYRGDWLQRWAEGHDDLSATTELPSDQRWQSALWRELLSRQDGPTRPELHRRFLAALAGGERPKAPLARRVVLFGMTHVPLQTLEALAALSTRCQVLLAVPNPCRYHWADIIDGRELLRLARRRHPLRQGVDLAALGLDAMHAHAHPLLAAWGRQGRDFVRQLDAFDDALQAQQHFALNKVDLFDDGPGETLLQQVQARIRDLVPLREHEGTPPPDEDRSIVFHIGHSPQRELEILHDQLLRLLAEPPPPGKAPLHPRDIVVMVPDVDVFAPAIAAVFGQYGRGDPRHIPFDIADRTERGNNPLLVAVEWLLQLPLRRCTFGELRDLLDVPALAQRFGLAPDELPLLGRWIAGAGIRWGLDPAHRESLGLEACGEQNTWLWGLRRMLLGYANGGGAALQGIEPYGEVGGLDAGLAGSLAELLERLSAWRLALAEAATPVQWAERLRALLQDFFELADERDRLTLAALEAGLNAWLQACATAGFAQPVDLAVAREAWLGNVDEPALTKRFRAGGVTFCTLMPMRSVPFELVCLLGMNDGDYPRRGVRSDFDLMTLPGVARPGDRSRRDDDRQLMLEALLSARRMLYVSWAGRSPRDNAEQPPSVLVSQLRDYLAAGWGAETVVRRTQEHPLQPFSRRYFEAGEAALFTYAGEWRAAHASPLERVDVAPRPYEPDPDQPLKLDVLAAFLKNPVKAFFRQRLDVVFREGEAPDDNDESFGLDGLGHYGLLGAVLDAALQETEAVPDLPALVAGIRRTGQLPMAEFGRRTAELLVDEAGPMLLRWAELQRMYLDEAPSAPLRFEAAGLQLDDWLDGVRAAPGDMGRHAWFELTASKLCGEQRKPAPRPDKLIDGWVRMLAASACGIEVQGVLVGRDAMLTLQPLPQDAAEALLATLIECWREGMDAPLPLAPRTAFAYLQDPKKAQDAYEGGMLRGENEEPCLARSFPDYESLLADGRFETLAPRVYGPLLDWIGQGGVEVLAHAFASEEATGDD